MADAPYDSEKLAVVGQRRPGRPPSLTDDARRMVITFLCNSLSRTQACRMVGVSLQTLSNTMKRDPGFKLEVHRAELSGMARAAAVVTEAAGTDPKMALEYLQRRDPDRWAKRTRVKLEAGGPTTDGRDAVKELLAKLGVTGATVVEPAAAAAHVPAGEATEGG